jgi:protein RecA
MNIWGWEGCLTGDSKILDADTGIQYPISDIVDGKAVVFNVPGTTCYIDDNDMAGISPSRILTKYDSGTKPCIKLTTEHGASISASTKHPFLVAGKGWTSISEIEIGDFIARPKRIVHNDTIQSTERDQKFAKLVGYLLGNGCLTGESVRIAAYTDAVVDDIKELVLFLYPDLSVKRCSTLKRTYSISMNNSTKKGGNSLLNELREFKIMGRKHLNKEIPYKLIQSDDRVVSNLLAGLFMSDGHVAYKKARVQYCSISKNLAEQVQYLLYRMGVVSSIMVRRRAVHHTLYTVNAQGLDNIKPLKDMPLVGMRLERLTAHLNKTAHKSMYTSNPIQGIDKWIPENVWWDKVSSLDNIGEQQVYNLTVFGAESLIANDIITHNTGKTLTALTVAANVQKIKIEPTALNPGGYGRVAFLDAEGSFSPSMASSVGVDLDKLTIFRSTPERLLTGEDWFNLIGILIQNGIEMIIVDSAPSLIPSSRLTAVIGQGQKATQAQMMAEGLQQVNAFLNSVRTPIVWFINQVRMKPMVMHGPTEDHTGGAALKFFSTYSLEVKKKDKEDIIKCVPNRSGNGFENRTIGVRIHADLHKNKTATIPQDGIEYDILFESVTDKDGISYTAGVDIFKDVFQTALMCGVIKQQSSWYSYGDIKTNGEDAFILALRKADPSVLEAIRKEVLGI